MFCFKVIFIKLAILILRISYMLLSIIVPIYNAGIYLESCLNSLLSQTFSDIEILLIDDCSIDNSRLLCEKYAFLDSRVRLFFNETNRGVSYSRNLGIKSSLGKYIMFVDADDELDANYIQDIFPKNDVDIVVSSFIYNDKSAYKVPIQNFIFKGSDICKYLDIYSTRFTSSWAKIYRASIIKMNQIYFDENCCHGEDTLFLYDYLLKVQSIECKESYGYYYRVDHSNTLSKIQNTFAQHIYTINELNDRLFRLGNQHCWCATESRIKITEYFLSRIIHNLKSSNSKFDDKVMTLRQILMSDYIKEAMKDMRYIEKGRKRSIFDLLASLGFYRLAVLFLASCRIA